MKQTQSTFSVSFYQRTDKKDALNHAPIYMRVTVNGERVEIATNRRCDISKWDNGQPIGLTRDAKQLADFIHSLRARIYEIHRNLIDRKEMITAKKIKDAFQGRDSSSKTLIEVFELHNEQVKNLIGKDFKEATYQRYVTTLKHVREFMQLSYKCNDMYLVELKYPFITDFEYYLKTVRNCEHNSAIKYIRNFKKIILLSLKNGWLEKNPFEAYTSKLKEVNRGFLTQDELDLLEAKEISTPRIDAVRDIFVFSCYTGLAYAEVLKLSHEHIIKGIDGEQWINIRRTKTDNKSIIPLLPKAHEIIEKYKDLPNGKILPTLSNQKMNAYLKEVGDLCGISKNLTFHLARHTFATTITLTNGVSIETVSAMLGHKSIKTTQIYSKVVEQKVSNDMAELRKKLEKK